MTPDETRAPDCGGESERNREPATRPLSAVDSLVPASLDDPLPEHIGGYRIIKLLGEGGMGVVYEAEQPQPKRLVALKVIKASFLSAALLRRFEREAEVLGRLHHPGIAQIYEAGAAVTPQGRQPYFAMELIRGQPLTGYTRAKQLTIPRRLELLIRICDAVQYAHQQGIIHRDLKPGNILVDDTDQPKILDFGIAKVTESDIQSATVQTDIGQLVGTLPYMSPEQAAGDPVLLDTRSDVYALGVIAYELMAGRLPYDLKHKMLAQSVRVIQEEEPTRLSIHDRHLRGDLETIVGKALEKDKTRRYQSASEFAGDIRRYLTDEPIAARPPSLRYQMSKFAKRNKALVAGLAAVFVALVLGVIGTSMGMVQARRQRAVADSQRAIAQNRSVELAAEVEAHRRTIYFQRIHLAESLYRDANISVMEQTLAMCPPDLRNWEWHRLRYMQDRSLATHTVRAPVYSVDWSPDGNRIALTAENGTGEVCDAATGRLLFKLDCPPIRDPFYHIVYSPDGKRLATSGADGMIRIWDAANGQEQYEMPLSRRVGRVAFSPDGTRLAFGGSGPPTMGVLDLRTWNSTFFDTVGAGVPGYLAWRPDGVGILFVYESRLRLIDAQSAKDLWSVMYRQRLNRVSSIDVSPDGKYFVVSLSDGSLSIGNAANGSEVRLIRAHDSAARNARYSPDGKWIASAGEDRTVRVWDAATGEQKAMLRGHRSWVRGVAWSPDGTRLASTGDASLKIWDPAAVASARLLGKGKEIATVKAVACTADGSQVVSMNVQGSVGIFDLTTGALKTNLSSDSPLSSMSVAPDARRLATLAQDGALRLWDVAGRKILWTVPDAASMGNGLATNSPIMMSPDGNRIYAGCEQRMIRVWNAQSGQLEATLSAEFLQGPAYSLGVSPDGKLLAAGSFDGLMGVIDIQSGVVVWSTRKGREKYAVSSLAFSPDGKVLAAGGRDGITVLANARTGRVQNLLRQRIQGLGGDVGVIDCVAWSPDGSRLVSAGFDGELCVWDAATGALALVLRGHQQKVNAVAFTADGKRIISGGDDRTLRLWESGSWNDALEVPASQPADESRADDSFAATQSPEASAP